MDCTDFYPGSATALKLRANPAPLGAILIVELDFPRGGTDWVVNRNTSQKGSSRDRDPGGILFFLWTVPRSFHLNL